MNKGNVSRVFPRKGRSTYGRETGEKCGEDGTLAGHWVLCAGTGEGDGVVRGVCAPARRRSDGSDAGEGSWHTYLLHETISGGNALNGRAASPGANPVMNMAARENTLLKSSGVSKGLGKGSWPSAARTYELWRASTERMLAAAVR